MSILVDEKTRLITQGITGREGMFHTEQSMKYGTRVVGGVTPGKGGQKVLESIPVFNTVRDAVVKTKANATMIFVPPPFASDAILEAADAGIELIICITEGIPVSDMVNVYKYLQGTNSRLVGPNCPGVISPGKAKIGIMPAHIHKKGTVGIISRSGTLTYEAVGQLTALGIGQSTCVGIGGDPISGVTFVDILEKFQNDPDTDNVVMIGEIGGTKEQEAAEYIKSDFTKPIAALIVGQSAPPGKRMGHAGAIITGSAGKAEEKQNALSAAGVSIIPGPGAIADTLKELTS